jgi:hypothetical protein
MATTETIVELILRCELAGIPLDLWGSVKGGKLEELSAHVPIPEKLNESLGEFLKALGDFGGASNTLNTLTDGNLEIKLDSLAFGYRNIEPKFAQVAVALTAGRNRCRFVCLKPVGKGKSGFVAGVELRLDKDLFKENALSGLVGNISLGDLGIYYASAYFPGVPYDPDPPLRQSDSLLPIKLSEKTRDFTSGLNWTAQVSIGKLFDWSAPIPKLSPAEPQAGGGEQASPPKKEELKGPTKWFEVGKSLGPISFRRIGLGYEAPRVSIKFDASLQLSVLTLSLDGLGMSYPLDKLSEVSSAPSARAAASKFFDNLAFTLDGMGLAVGKGPVEIGGSLVRVPDAELLPGCKLQLDGALLIRTAVFSLSAIGSYADLNGTPSVMAYAVLLYAIGGDPAFFITGLAFGFGVNRRLRLPPIEEVQNFPLIQAAMGKQDADSILQLPKKLRDYVSPVVGNFWIAAGIKFTSYSMLESFALLSVSFGVEFEIALLGLSRMSVPPLAKKGDPTIACAELAIRAVIRPADGVFSLEGRLTSESYIFSKSCRITGGFAFFVWFAGPHAGDFVVTLGGYHPEFVRPPHYPIVPRLGVNWQVTDQLAVTAEMYFALTASCLMAGGKLSAVYQSKIIKAWFIVYADFLISWKPFYYKVRMGISIGVEADLGLFSIKFHLSVQVQIWGPEFAGRIDVDLTIVSFSVLFGPPETPPVPLTADEFKKTFLPESSPVIASSLTGGLIREVTRKTDGKELRVVNGHALELTIRSKIPVTGFLDPLDPIQPKALPKAEELGINPMGKEKLDSKIKVSLDGLKGRQKDLDNLLVESIQIGVPEALWGPAKEEGKVPKPLPKAEIIKANAGLRISFKPRDPGGSLLPMPIRRFKFINIERPIPWDENIKFAKPLEAGYSPEAKPESRLAALEILASADVTAKRQAILDVLAYESPFELNKVDLSKLAAKEYRLTYFQHDPEIWSTGGEFR